MIQNGYEEQITIKYSETDQNLAMKPFALLNFLQDIASENADALGFGFSFVQENSSFYQSLFHYLKYVVNKIL